MSDETALEPTGSSVPALASTPALEITAEDVALPRIRTAQFMSPQVQEGNVKVGSIFSSLGSDDPDPDVLYEEGADEGVLFHVLSMTRGKSVSEDGELILFDYNDPDAPPEAWVTYNYVVVVPEYDAELPYKWLLTRSGKSAAQQINMVLAKTSAQGPPYNQAFQMTTTLRENKKGKWYVPRVRHVEAVSENIAICESISQLISPDVAALRATGDEPAI